MNRRARSLASVLVFATLCHAVPASAAAQPPAVKREGYTRTVAIVVYEGVEILDFTGPAEVFKAAGGFGEVNGQPAFRPYIVGPSTEPLTSQGFIKIVPEYSFANAPRPDIVVIPGGNTGRLIADPLAMAWIKRVVDESEVAVSVCSGAFALVKTGITDGKDITTWYGAVERLREVATSSRVHAGRRFIDNDRFITTAGVSAGIDGSLHLVARLLGRSVADQTAQYMEYRWTPEAYISSHYATLNPSTDARGRALQLASLNSAGGNAAEARRVLDELVAKDPADADTWYILGTTLVSDHDYDAAARAFGKSATKPELRVRSLYNLACAQALANRKSEALDALRKAVDAGFKSKSQVMADSDLASLKGDARLDAILKSMPD
ncbi:MAG: DJ-1/PfpI family protein [Thermoanaerobaculia bacterium]